MLKITTLALAVSAVPFASVLAADLGPRGPMPMPMPVSDEFADGWYLRGDIGIGSTKAQRMEYLPNPRNNPNDFQIESFGMGDQSFVGFGVGYQATSWLRFDVTAEYRAKAAFDAWGSYTVACTAAGGVCLDVYSGFINSVTVLANAYLDLGTWCGITPFVGAGIGTSRNTVTGFSDFGPQTGGRGLGPTTSDFELAWALHAGMAYSVTRNVKLELAYRYLNMGSVTAPINCIGGCNPDSYKFHNMDSHDVKLGMRWMFDTPVMAPVLIRKG
ncbi:MAG: outer membrane beta-barrel protein [Bradyrhizobium sp.]